MKNEPKITRIWSSPPQNIQKTFISNPIVLLNPFHCPYFFRWWPTVTWYFHHSVPRTTTKRFTLRRTVASHKIHWEKSNPEMSTYEQVQTAFSLLKDGQKIDTFFALGTCQEVWHSYLDEIILRAKICHISNMVLSLNF